jgi:phytoene dehydrogenase-like protein
VTAFDVVVAGAGHNSLICAAYLSRAGLRVLVLERAERAGGDATTEEVTLPGFRHDTCGSAHTIFQSSPIVRDDELELGRYGLRYLFPDPVVVMPFADGESLTMWRDRARTRQEIARHSESDAAAYDRMLADWDRIKVAVGRLRYTPGATPADLTEALATAGGAEALGWRDASALDVVRERFGHERVRAFFAWISLMTMAYVDRPGTGLNALSLAAGRQAFSWTTAEGGSGALPDALVRIIADHGGAVRTGSEVTRIVIEGGRAAGVVTADGTVHRASRAVVSTIHPQHLVAAAPELGAALAARNARWRTNVTMFVTHYALAHAPRYRTSAGAIPAVAAAIAGSVDELADALDAHRAGRVLTERAPLLCISASAVDPSRAPAGRHTLKLVGFLPYAIADGGPARWDAIKADVSAALFDRYRQHVTGLGPADVLGSYIESPLDLERRNPHNFRGSCHGGDGAEPLAHRLPIPGLYQTGSTTVGGASISGAPGRNCARVVLEDLGIGLDAAIARHAVATA